MSKNNYHLLICPKRRIKNRMIQLCKFFLFYLLISIDFHTFSLRNPLKIDPMDNILFWLVPVASVLALCFAYYFHKQMMKNIEFT